MNRKLIFLTAALTVTCLLTALGYKTYKTSVQRKKAATMAQTLPALPFRFVNEKHGPPYQYTLINYFSPDCEHCQYMAGQLTLHSAAFSNTHVFMITPATFENASRFAENYGLSKLNFVSVGTDPGFQFPALFGASMMPSFFLYGPDNRLLKKYIGETKIENLFITARN